jgi:hypothetical protein
MPAILRTSLISTMLLLSLACAVAQAGPGGRGAGGGGWAGPPQGAPSAERGVQRRANPPPRPARAPLERRGSLDEAVADVQRRTGGRILSAETLEERGRAVHSIRVLTPEGRVRTFELEARPDNQGGR